MNWERVERLFGAENLQILASKRAGIIGLGSGGGFVALSLAMSGVSKFLLIDDDILEEGNIARHVADLRYVGQSKVEAVADLIRQRNPRAEIDARFGRIEQEIDALDDLDILVVAIDNENIKYIINEACLQRNLTAIYAGVYERGEGGDVAIIIPYRGPCYACWAERIREDARDNAPAAELDYGMIGESGTLEAEPGLWAHVAKVASVQSDLVINELLQETDVSEEMPGNTIIMANNWLEIISGHINEPHTAVWVDIERDPDCLVCGDRIRLHNKTVEAISLEDLNDMIGEEDNQLRDEN